MWAKSGEARWDKQAEAMASYVPMSYKGKLESFQPLEATLPKNGKEVLPFQTL